MISRDRLRILARELGVRQGYAEKNYVNSWLLWGIFTSDYGDNLLFKGGTALSKLYFPQSWRFSEDLDFGVEGQYQGSKQELRTVLDTISDRSGIEFTIQEHHESHQEHYPTHYVDISIQYRSVLDHPNTTSIDVMVDEHVSPSVQTLNALATRRPDVVAAVVPDVLLARGRSVPLHDQVSGLVEAVVDVGPAITDDTVAALEGTLRSTEGNLAAARALAALYQTGHTAVSDDYEIFVGPYRDGDLDGTSHGGKGAFPPVASADPAFVTEALYDVFDHWADNDERRGPRRTLAAVADAELAAVRPILDDLVAVT